jgi:tRNA (cmo5U34)-methyltransferase
MKKWNTETLRTEPLEEMSAFFNKRADEYNQVHVGNIGGGIESIDVVASFLPEHTKTLVDFGIGTGMELNRIFKRFPDAKVTGIDIAEKMLKKIESTYPGKNITLFCESYLTYDFGISRFDAAISVMTMHHYEHKTKTDLYKKVRKCLNENGVYIECDYMLSEKDYENPQELEDFYFSEYEALKEKQNITDDRQYHYDRPCTVKNQIKMFAEAGFKNIKEVWHDGNSVILLAEK